MKTSLAQEPWVRAADTLAIMAALHAGAAAGEVVARFVGGCVRNALFELPFDEIDIATVLTPEEVTQRLQAAGLKAVPTGIEHGTITGIVHHEPFEITTLRRDVSTDGRRATVAFTDDWAEDAARRDFTMNALYADPDGTLRDPLGGLEDLKARRVRFIGDAHARIAEDYLRVLRFFRFHALYGAGELDPAGLKACAEAKDNLGSLSAERIQGELFKLLSASDPVPTLRAMTATHILQEVLPEARHFDVLDRLAAIDRMTFFEADPVLRLGALVACDLEGMKVLSDRLRLSNAQKARLVGLVGSDFKIVSYLSIREVRRAAYRLGKQALMDRIMLHWAADPKASNEVQWRALLAMVEGWQRPVMPLSGEDVMRAGVPKGPQVGQVLAEVEDWWVDADFTEDEFSIAERLKAVVQAVVF
ncbi:MAG: CCA tRNA nucleotidyltransferase [Alphaproteobacteria bacterium]|nr:MAG: CCA tRNA nucleotidyltransferase [Alphaproteobacteria bacterium]